jgi:hypothetical protein
MKVSSTVAAAAAAVDDEDGVQWRWQRSTATVVGATNRR